MLCIKLCLGINMNALTNKFTLVLLAIVIIAITAKHSYANSDTLSKNRKTQLVHLVKQDCGSCHGMTLQGGLGPALLSKNLENKPLLFIQNTILYGRAGTAMPPWKPLLSEQEALWIAKQLKQGTIASKTINN